MDVDISDPRSLAPGATGLPSSAAATSEGGEPLDMSDDLSFVSTVTVPSTEDLVLQRASSTQQQPPPSAPAPAPAREEPLFLKFYVVALFSKTSNSRVVNKNGEDPKLEPVVLEQFPPSLASNDMMAKAVPGFCFPERDYNLVSATSEMYVFVMTDGNGDRQYGFCRRRTPRKNQRELYTECLCIVSYYPWFNLFNQMLQYLEERRETVEHRRETLDPFKPFLQAVQAHPLPTPGDQFRIRIASEFVDQKLPMHYFLQRPDETATGLHHVDFSHIFSNFDDRNIFTIFASVLLERRIIFMSSSLPQLSGCVHAAVNLVYPFSWQHIFIPVLPSSLLDYIHAPMPFVVGIHTSLRPMVERIIGDMSDAIVIVDIDAHTCQTTQDDSKFLPEVLLARLKSALREFLPRSLLGGAIERKLEQVSNVAISEAFLSFLASIFGNYYKYFDPTTFKFQQDVFCQEQPRALQPLLVAFAGSQMYEQFIVSRAIRLKMGMDIQFRTKVLAETRMERFTATSYQLTSKAMGSIVRSSKGAKVLMGRAMDKIQQSSMMSSPEKRAGISPSPSMTNVTKSPSSSRINISGMFGSTGRSSTELTGSDGSRQISRNPSMESVQSEFSDDPNVSGASTSRRSSILRPSSTPNAPPPARRPQQQQQQATQPTLQDDLGLSIRNDFISLFRSTPTKTPTPNPIGTAPLPLSSAPAPPRSPTKSQGQLQSQAKTSAFVVAPEPVLPHTFNPSSSSIGQSHSAPAASDDFADFSAFPQTTLASSANSFASFPPIAPVTSVPLSTGFASFDSFNAFQPPKTSSNAAIASASFDDFADFATPESSATAGFLQPSTTFATPPRPSSFSDGNMIDFHGETYEKNKAQILSSFNTGSAAGTPQHGWAPMPAATFGTPTFGTSPGRAASGWTVNSPSVHTSSTAQTPLPKSTADPFSNLLM